MKSRSQSATVEPTPIVPLPTGDLWDYALIAAIFSGMFALAYAALATPLLRPLVDLAQRQHWGGLWVRPTIIWITMGFVLLLMRTLLWLRYRPFAPAAEEEAPSLTVIIPAYNEGAMVENSIASVAKARYPRERLQIIAVDDGSRDDTWNYILRAALRYPGLVTPVRLPENLGKRSALAEGFRRATGDIIVTVDSDSVISPETLLAIAGPFRDPRVGAVAGKVAVHNRRAAHHPAHAARALHPVIRFSAQRAVGVPHGVLLPGRSRGVPYDGRARRCSRSGSGRPSSACRAPTARTARSPT